MVDHNLPPKHSRILPHNGNSLIELPYPGTFRTMVKSMKKISAASWDYRYISQ